ncbi:phenylalanine--tRNA ligase subunit beta [Conexibacter sp. JD483]|uniref:phenylalanine--tRNA ligase subunit beta n=1 Tax=unclassified Conexibacter TaxID=2627773 RepID=UPI00271C800E|nr:MULTISPECIES: phenylalanine--tRNA ligase subunit beta [unclassified Conexibacter]MDO8185713.1 phenylalanine--tRNA ligase subunit beta [Conexibacter sp. CPCC 205706]MDO8199090.1 phenylalanine--tRNA ligase subunit beta [Conexibacter sp. CPCC 205762]MDR9370491.1 phenylalanine--tRNA ligase subunit beta [Conexibacter sp. JD483]
MKVPLSWLHEHVHPELTADELSARLALTGTEVERVTHHGVPSGDHFVVAKVLEAVQHPDADRLRVTKLDVGEEQPLQVVCGAPNARAGITVALARPGSRLPDGTKLKKAKLRGVESNGMILGESEVDIGVDHDGIMELPDELIAGTPLGNVLPLETDVLELEITPNRPDCLGIYGVAREVHAATGAPLGPPPWAHEGGREQLSGALAGIDVTIETERCPRFTARIFENVTVGPSPYWLKARLMAAGQRPISNVVDITNYVMLLTGQPLHAFDLDRVAGGRLVVRDGRDGDTLETLDGETRRLDPDMVVICDADGPTSLAGVMGGARSEVVAATTTVLLESAVWDGPNIQRTSTRLALRSEASGRFEKGLSPEGTLEAQAVATRLLVELCGATVREGTLDVARPSGWDAAHATIRLRDTRVTGLLGADIPRTRSAEILGALGFGTADADDGLDATVPHFRRNDVTREADLIEEVARIDGVDNLPATLPLRRGASGQLTQWQQLRRKAADTLVGAGLHEVIGWSWSPQELADRLRLPADDHRRQSIAVENPMSADHSVLRTTLLGGLLDVAQRNVTRGTSDVAIFESGAVFAPSGQELPHEPHLLGVLLTGALRPPNWVEPRPPRADFFAAKGVLAHLLDTLRVTWKLEVSSESFLHPGRTARVIVTPHGGGDEVVVGWIGELHPTVAADWDLERTAAFMIDLNVVIAAVPGPAVYADYTSFPEIRQDLAVVLPATVPAGEVVATVRAAGGPLLADAGVFDVYSGTQIGEGNVSLALRLAFRAPDRTLTDEEVGERRTAIEEALATLGGTLRA